MQNCIIVIKNCHKYDHFKHRSLLVGDLLASPQLDRQSLDTQPIPQQNILAIHVGDLLGDVQVDFQKLQLLRHCVLRDFGIGPVERDEAVARIRGSDGHDGEEGWERCLHVCLGGWKKALRLNSAALLVNE